MTIRRPRSPCRPSRRPLLQQRVSQAHQTINTRFDFIVGRYMNAFHPSSSMIHRSSFIDHLPHTTPGDNITHTLGRSRELLVLADGESVTAKRRVGNFPDDLSVATFFARCVPRLCWRNSIRKCFPGDVCFFLCAFHDIHSHFGRSWPTTFFLSFNASGLLTCVCRSCRIQYDDMALRYLLCLVRCSVH